MTSAEHGEPCEAELPLAPDTAPAEELHDHEQDVPEREVTNLTEPHDGLPPVIVTQQELAEAEQRLAAGTGPVAVDAERASGYRYGQRAYLVQLRREGAGTVLIDPIACPDLSGVNAALAGAEAVLHAASQDLPCLAEIGYRPRLLFDTELAGRLLGYPRVALGTMLEEVLGYRLAKEHSAADWSIRPLSEEMLTYAALDVEVLIELRDALGVQLGEQGKTEWARQEFAAIAATLPAPPRPDPWRRTSGIHRVRTRRALAVVRELWTVRDEIARDADLSPRRVLTDQAIIEAARLPPAGQLAPGQAAPGQSAPGQSAPGQSASGKVETGRPQLDKIGGFRARNAREHRARWVAAVARARALADDQLPDVTGAPVVAGPPPAHRWSERDPDAAARLAAAREAVSSLAESHRLPAENLLAPDALRRLSWEPPVPVTPETVAAALAGYGARPWQTGLTAEPLARALADASAADSGAANSDTANSDAANSEAGYSEVADNAIRSAGDHSASGELT